MNVHLEIRNESVRKGLFRSDVLRRLAERVCAEERAGRKAGASASKAEFELSILFCDDEFIAKLNRQYRKKNGPTDVLSFAQKCPADSARRLVLGDIVISLETVEARYPGDTASARDEVRLLFCHGLLHLLGHSHATEKARQEMAAKQAAYLKISPAAAWPVPPLHGQQAARRTKQRGG